MSKKTLLNESTVRRFMKLAEIAPLTTHFVNENYPMVDDDEAAEEAVPADATPAEADWDAAEFEAGEEAASEDEGEDLGVDVVDVEEDPTEGGELTLTDEEAEVFLKVADRIRDVLESGPEVEDIPAPDMGEEEELDVDLGVEDVDVDVEEEDIELEEDQGYAAEEDESLGMRRGKESSKEQSEKDRRGDSYGKWDKRDKEKRGTPLEENKANTSKEGDNASANEDLVNEIVRRVTKRVLQSKKK
jgi:hypothetical protein